MAGAFKRKPQVVYLDGDGWERVIVVEKVLPRESGAAYPVCVDGKLHGPPDDCGRIPGSYRLLEALRDPHHPEHKELLDWVGGEFNPEAFSVEEANQRLAPIQRWWAKSLK